MIDRLTMSTAVVEAFFKLLGRIPRKWAIRSGNALGRIWFLADRKHRRITLDNLTLAFGDEKNLEDIQKLARHVYNNLAQILFEIGWSLLRDANQLKTHYRIEGLSHIKQAYEKGRGVILLTGHIGNWELFSSFFGILGFSLAGVYRPLDFKPLDRFFINLRTRFGARLVPKNRSLRELLRGLRRGEIVGLLIDQNVDWYEGVFVDFFGARACTTTGIALLALKTKAPVIPGFVVRDGSGFSAKFLPEVPLLKTGDKRKDVEENIQQYNKVLEAFIRCYPEQWFWVHRRWKTKPYHPWPRGSEQNR